MKTLDELMREVLSYNFLKPGWAGTVDSKPPSTRAVLLACEFLRTIPEGFPLPGPMISNTGKIGFYWWARRRYYIDLEIDVEAETFSLFAKKAAKEEEPEREWFIDRLTVAHFTVPFFNEHFSGIRDEYATQPESTNSTIVDPAHGRSEQQRDDVIRVG